MEFVLHPVSVRLVKEGSNHKSKKKTGRTKPAICEIGQLKVKSSQKNHKQWKKEQKVPTQSVSDCLVEHITDDYSVKAKRGKQIQTGHEQSVQVVVHHIMVLYLRLLRLDLPRL